jgi:hypothetical protein
MARIRCFGKSSMRPFAQSIVYRHCRRALTSGKPLSTNLFPRTARSHACISVSKITPY